MVKIDSFVLTPDEVMVTDLVEKGEILTGKNSGRRQDMDMYIEYGGTFYNYSMTLHRRAGCSREKWDELFMILTNPICDHELIVPHNQRNLQFTAYISSASRKLLGALRENEWGDYQVEFIAMRPQWRAGGSQPSEVTP